MRLRPADKALLYSGLAKMVRAGFGVPRAAETMLAQGHRPAVRCYLTHLRDSLQSGSDLTGATATVPLPSVGPLEKQIVAAGEKGGQIETAYNHLAGYFTVVHKTSRQIRRRLYYPFILLTLGVLLPALPKAVAAPEVGPVIIGAFKVLGLVYLGVALLFFLGVALLRSARTSIAADNFIHRLPLFGKVRRTLSLARFCKVFHIYLLSAVRFSETMRAAAAASNSARLIKESERIALAIDAGQGFSVPLSKSRAFDAMFRSSFATAEEAGDLDGEAKRWSELMEEESKEAVERLGEWLPRIIYTCIAGYVIYQIFQMVGGYFDQIKKFMP